MPPFLTASRARRTLKETGAEIIQNTVMVLPQHTAGRLVDRHYAATLVKENNPLFEVVEKLFQAGQGKHELSSFH